MGSHHGRGWPLGICRAYDDRPEGLYVDFLLVDEVVDPILDGDCPESSIGWTAAPPEGEHVGPTLDHIALLMPPERGACPGTGLLELHPSDEAWTPKPLASLPVVESAPAPSAVAPLATATGI